VLRLAVAVVFIAHGAQKAFGWWGGDDLAGSADYLVSLGFASLAILTVVFGAIEVFGGVLLLAGAYARWVAAVLALDVVALASKAHVLNGFFLTWTLAPGVGHGYEYDLVLLAALVCLMITGPGTASVDAYRNRAAEAAAAGLARIRAGKV
jgi:putative oxidoreductase